MEATEFSPGTYNRVDNSFSGNSDCFRESSVSYSWKLLRKGGFRMDYVLGSYIHYTVVTLFE